MARSSAPEVLERPRVRRDIPVPRRAADGPVLHEAVLHEAVLHDAVLHDAELHDAEPRGDEATRPARRSPRLPLPPGRRAPLWFAALVIGALLAAAPSVLSSPVGPTAAASDYGVGASSELGLGSDVDDAGVRRSITEAEAQARLGELAASRAARTPTTVLPTQGRLTTCYCMRWGQMHWGIDLAAPLGTPIYAATDGVVLRAGPATGFGNAVYIQDADGNVEIYGHMKYYNVHAGDVVHAGDQIAKVGSQGQSTGPHLHFEIHRGGMQGRPTNPQTWLHDRGVDV